MAPSPRFQRRRLLRLAGTSLLASPALALTGCSRGGDAITQTVAEPAASADDGASWASGGTARIGDAARFPDPFGDDLSTACALTCMATIGPCHTTSPERRDVSYGWDG